MQSQNDAISAFSSNRHSINFTLNYSKVTYQRLTGTREVYTPIEAGIKGGYKYIYFINNNLASYVGINGEILSNAFEYIFEENEYGNQTSHWSGFNTKPFLMSLPLGISYSKYKKHNAISLSFEIQFIKAPRQDGKYFDYFENIDGTYDTLFVSSFKYKTNVFAGFLAGISYKRLLKNQNIIAFTYEYRITPYNFLSNKYFFAETTKYPASQGELTSTANYFGFMVSYEFAFGRKSFDNHIHY